MTTSGARTQKPVGSAAWVSTEKENVSQLVEQEMEEVEYPVAHEMDWLNEHMAEIFDNNNLCVMTDSAGVLLSTRKGRDSILTGI